MKRGSRLRRSGMGQHRGFAFRPLTRLGNRFWLPFLQGHIWIFYLLGLPAAAFRLIPTLNYGLAMAFLGLVSLDANGRKLSGPVFSLLLMVCFAWQQPSGRLGTALYQEVLGAAFLYGLIWAGALRPNPGKWVWMLPALWLASVFAFLVVKGQLSQPGAVWPLMINTDGPRVFSRLSEADGYWQGLRNFVAPTLYMSREFVSPDAGALPASCDVVILRSGASVPVGPGFTQIRTCTVKGVEYNIYRRLGY